MVGNIIQIATLILLTIAGAISYHRAYRAGKLLRSDPGVDWFLHFSFEIAFSMTTALYACCHVLKNADLGQSWAFHTTFAAYATTAFLGAIRKARLNVFQSKRRRDILDASVLIIFILAIIGTTLLALFWPPMHMR
jgi:hypothetical protein